MISGGTLRVFALWQVAGLMTLGHEVQHVTVEDHGDIAFHFPLACKGALTKLRDKMDSAQTMRRDATRGVGHEHAH